MEQPSKPTDERKQSSIQTSVHPRKTQQSITTEPMTMGISPTAKPLLVTEPQTQSQAGNIQTYMHTNKPTSSSYHSFKTWHLQYYIGNVNLHSKMKTNTSSGSNVATHTHTTSSKTTKVPLLINC